MSLAAEGVESIEAAEDGQGVNEEGGLFGVLEQRDRNSVYGTAV